MGKCHKSKDIQINSTDPCHPVCSVPVRAYPETPDGVTTNGQPLAWFDNMIPNCLAYASDAKARGKHIVGILCEYTPRELIMAADAVPVCLCGGSAEMIGPAEEHLPANLCPLIKSTYGYHVQRANPFLEIADMSSPRPPATARRR
jgi:hypothetical protein